MTVLSQLLKDRVLIAPVTVVPVNGLAVLPVTLDAVHVLASEPSVRLRTAEVPLAFTSDSFVWVEVFGEPDETYAALAPGFVPIAFTNPVPGSTIVIAAIAWSVGFEWVSIERCASAWIFGSSDVRIVRPAVFR